MRLSSIKSVVKNRFRLVISVFLLFIVVSSVSVTYFVTSPYFANIVKNWASGYLTKTLHKKVAIQSLKISIFAPQIVVKGITLHNVSNIKEIKLFFGPFDFFKRKIIIDKINIIDPKAGIIIKNGSVENFKGLQRALRYFSKNRFSFLISVSFKNIELKGGDFKLRNNDKNIFLSVKGFNADVSKRSGGEQLFAPNYGFYVSYNAPRIHLVTSKINQIYYSFSPDIYLFKSFIGFKQLSFNSSYFHSVSNGVIALRTHPSAAATIPGKDKNTPLRKFYNLLGGIFTSIHETTDINIAHISKLPENLMIMRMNGAIRAKLSITGSFPDITSKADIYLNHFVFPGGNIKNGFMDINYDSKKGIMKFARVSLKMFKGSVTSKGVINLNDGQGRFVSKLSKLSIGNLIDFYASEKIPQFRAAAAGDVTTFFNLRKNFYVVNIVKISARKPVQQIIYASKLKGLTKTVTINYKYPIFVTGNILVNNNSCILNGLNVSSEMLKGRVNGNISYIKKNLTITFNSRYSSMPEISLIKDIKNPYFKPEASGTVRGLVSGKFNSVIFDLHSGLNSASINRYLDNYNGHANVVLLPDGIVDIKNVKLTENTAGTGKKGIISFGGKIFGIKGIENINARFKTRNIHFFSKKFSFVFNSSGLVNGTLHNPNVNMSVFSGNIKVYGIALEHANARFLLTDKSLNVKRFNAVSKAGNITAYGMVNFLATKKINYNYDLYVHSNNINISKTGFHNFTGKYHINVSAFARVNLHIGGLFSLPEISGSAFASNIYINHYYLKNIHAGIKSSASKTTVNISALNGKFTTTANILLKKGYPFNFTSKINNAGFNYKKTLFGLAGGVYGSGKLSSLRSSYVFAEINYIYIKHGQFFLKNIKNIRLAYMNKTLSLSGVELRGKDNYLQVRGKITRTRYDLIINARTELWVLSLLSNKVVNSSGYVSSSAVVFGNIAHPQIYGYATLKKGLIKTAVNSEFVLSRLNGKITFNKNMIVIKTMHFRMLHGFFSSRGYIMLKNFRPDYYHIKTNFHLAVYRVSNYFYAISSGTLQYNGSQNKGEIYGTVKIKKAIYNKRINLSSFLISYKRYSMIKPVIKKGVFNPFFNINVISNKSIFVKNNILDAGFSTKMRIAGTLYNPDILGAINSSPGGKLHFRGTSFHLRYASVTFSNPYKIYPVFTVATYTHINQYIIRMNAHGSFLNFNVNFSSTPPLSELDIVSMLALGVPSNSIYSSSAGSIAASEAASAVGGGVESGITGAISNYFGFKNLSIAPSYSAVTRSVAPQVIASKRLTRRLTISYSNTIASQSSQSVALTYKLAHHVSLIGEWENNQLAPNNSNVFSEVGGNIVFRFRFY